MWPFTLLTKEETWKVNELKAIKIGELLYAPKPDITPHEVALLLPIFGTLSYWIDREQYLKNHNLLRHFKRDLN